MISAPLSKSLSDIASRTVEGVTRNGGLLISGTFTASDNGQPFVLGPQLLRAGTYGGKSYWSSDGLAQGTARASDYTEMLYASGQSKWYLQGHRGAGDAIVYSAVSGVSAADDPSSLSWSTPGLGTGIATVTAT